MTPEVRRIIGAYGGLDLENTYPNGDQVGYVTVVYECELPHQSFELEQEELIEVAWHDMTTIATLSRHGWIDRVLRDAAG